jgi:hypothetical protein
LNLHVFLPAYPEEVCLYFQVITLILVLLPLAAIAGTDSTPVKGEPSQVIHPAYANQAAEKETSLFGDELVGTRSPRGSRSFFKSGSASSVFTEETSLTDQPKLQMLNARIEPEPVENASIRLRLNSSSPQSAVAKEELSKLPLADRLKVEFGGPGGEPEITPEQNAPKPFKAAIAALEGGDSELAFKYARQWARYQRNLKERSKKVSDLTIAAMQLEGMVDAPELSELPEYSEARQLFEKARNEELDVASAARTISLPETSRTLLNRALEDEDQSYSIGETSKKEVEKPRFTSEAEEQRAARSEFSSLGAPRDPKGKVAVYCFFRHTDKDALISLALLDYLAVENQHDERLRFAGFTLDNQTDFNPMQFQQAARLSIPIRPGADFADQLKIKRSPTFVAVAVSSGSAFVIEGPKSSVYLKELVRFMQGEK